YPEVDFRRGFPYFATLGYESGDRAFRPESVLEAREVLLEVFRTTTIRALRLSLHYTPHLHRILAATVGDRLTALSLHAFRARSDDDAAGSMIAGLCQSDAPRGLNWLALTGAFETADLDSLMKTPMEKLIRLDCQGIHGSAAAAARFFASPGVRR